MPLFYNLDRYGQEAGRVAVRLKALRHTLQNHPDGAGRSVPDKNATDTLLLATWNLKEFEGGRNDRRIDESYWYIAEIISHFDLVAIQEVGGHFGALNKLRRRQMSDHLIMGLELKIDYSQEYLKKRSVGL